jgi:hypothetical protein
MKTELDCSSSSFKITLFLLEDPRDSASYTSTTGHNHSTEYCSCGSPNSQAVLDTKTFKNLQFSAECANQRGKIKNICIL